VSLRQQAGSPTGCSRRRTTERLTKRGRPVRGKGDRRRPERTMERPRQCSRSSCGAMKAQRAADSPRRYCVGPAHVHAIGCAVATRRPSQIAAGTGSTPEVRRPARSATRNYTRSATSAPTNRHRAGSSQNGGQGTRNQVATLRCGASEAVPGHADGCECDGEATAINATRVRRGRAKQTSSTRSPPRRGRTFRAFVFSL